MSLYLQMAFLISNASLCNFATSDYLQECPQYLLPCLSFQKLKWPMTDLDNEFEFENDDDAEPQVIALIDLWKSRQEEYLFNGYSP